MGLNKNYFWRIINYHNNIALIDTFSNQSYTYNQIKSEIEKIGDKLKLPDKGLVFLFTTNNAESVITYIATLKSGNAVLLLDEKLNDEIRNDLIKNYKPDFIVTSNDLVLDEYTFSSGLHSLKFFKEKIQLK